MTHHDEHQVPTEEQIREQLTAQGATPEQIEAFLTLQRLESQDELSKDEFEEMLRASGVLQGATEEQIDAFVLANLDEAYEQHQQQAAIEKRLNAALEGITEEDAETYASPNDILDAFELVLGDDPNAKTLLGIVASLIVTNSQLIGQLQQLAGQLQQYQMQAMMAQLMEEQAAQGIGEDTGSSGFPDLS